MVRVRTTMHFFKKFFDAANQSAEAVNRQIIRITQRNLKQVSI